MGEREERWETGEQRRDQRGSEGGGSERGKEVVGTRSGREREERWEEESER